MYRKGLSILAEIDDIQRLIPFLKNIRKNTAGMDGELFLIGSMEKEQESKVAAFADEGGTLRIRRIQQAKAAGLNEAMKEIAYDVIHFTKTSCEYGDGSIAAALEELSKHPEVNMVSLTPYRVSVQGEEIRNRRFQMEVQNEISRIDLEKTPERWIGYMFGLFLRTGAMPERRFDPRLQEEYRRVFLADVYSSNPSYYLLPDKIINHGFPDSDYYNYEPQYDKDWYEHELEILAELLSEPPAQQMQQRILMDFICLQFACNQGNRNKTILQAGDIGEYTERIHRILQNIEDRIIVQFDETLRTKRLKPVAGMMFLQIKYKTDDLPIQTVKKGKGIYEFRTEDQIPVAGSELIEGYVRAMNYERDQLLVDVEIRGLFFAPFDYFRCFMRTAEGAVYPAKRNEIYSMTKYFGVTANKEFTVQFIVPEEKKQKKTEYTIVLEYQGHEISVPLYFVKSQSRLSEEQPKCYWKQNHRIVTYDARRHCLMTEHASGIKSFACECSYLISLLWQKKDRKRARKAALMRVLYYLSRLQYGHKNIWVTFDQLFKGGDNGEYFYRYVSDLKNKKQKIYYVINSDTEEYRRLSSKYRTVLAFKSMKHRLICLNATLMFTTRAEVALYAGFDRQLQVYFRDLFNYDVLCLQHGLSIQQIAEYQNRLFDNLKYYFCVSKYEIENLSKPVYGFEDKSILKLTGAPRYDGLHSDPKKQIIITPTWRRNVTSGTNKKGSNHEYSPNFKHTEYYRIYNHLINDEQLIRCAQETGYQIIYLIHPILSPQIDDFEKNDRVRIVPGSEVNYEKILTESALMLTDHSGIMYDFAYQRKPLVYYHPDELPPQYAEGGLKYDTMGFGPVCRTHEQVVDALCEFMKDECRLQPKYRKRIEDFFAFDDFDNCKRVYEAALQYQADRK